MKMCELQNKIGIYKISFDGCDKVYIGQSINLRNRIKYHKVLLKKGTHYNSKLQRAYNKYKIINIDILEFLSYVDIDRLNELEQNYINKYDSFHNGLNCCIGGDSYIRKSTKKVYTYDLEGNMLFETWGYSNLSRIINVNESNIRQVVSGKMKTCNGYHFSIFLKNKDQVLSDISHAFLSLEYKNKRSKLSSGKNNGMYGKKHSTETREKIREKNKSNIRKSRFDSNEVINLYLNNNLTQKEIALKLGCNQVTIGQILLKNNIRKFKRKLNGNIATKQ